MHERWISMDTNDNILSVDIDKGEMDPESSNLLIQGIPLCFRIISMMRLKIFEKNSID